MKLYTFKKKMLDESVHLHCLHNIKLNIYVLRNYLQFENIGIKTKTKKYFRGLIMGPFGPTY
jgi:hypothetical protein